MPYIVAVNMTGCLPYQLVETRTKREAWQEARRMRDEVIEDRGLSPRADVHKLEHGYFLDTPTGTWVLIEKGELDE
jgi:hypothetical protein